MAVQKSELYFRVVKTIFFEWAEQVSKYIFEHEDYNSHLQATV